MIECYQSSIADTSIRVQVIGHELVIFIIISSGNAQFENHIFQTEKTI